MACFKRWLVATDFSDVARFALERAVLLASDQGRKTVIETVHVVGGAQIDTDRYSESIHAAKVMLSEHMAPIPANDDVQLNGHVRSGILLDELVQHARASFSEIIVIGNGKPQLMNYLGRKTNAERLVEQALCPVLSVRQPAASRYRKVLVPIDFSRSSLVAARTAFSLAPEAEIVFVHVFDVAFEGKLRMADVAKDTIDRYRQEAQQRSLSKMRELGEMAEIPAHQLHLVSLWGDPAHRLCEQEGVLQCDLIVMAKHNESMLMNLLSESVSYRVLDEANGDVLVLV